MSISLRWLSGLIGAWLCPLLAGAQDTTRTQFTAFVELGTTYSTATNRLPFWLTANQFGIMPINPQVGLAQAGIRYKTHLGRTGNWGVEAALEGVVQTNNPNVRGIPGPDAFARIFFRNWELVGGRRREIIGMQDSTLSSGGVLWSGNTLPIPQIRFGTSDFISLPFLRRWLKVKGHISHGWFENSRPFAQDVLLHAKSFYALVGKDTWPVGAYAGVIHMAQWAGYSPELAADGDQVFSRNGYFDSGWRAFWAVATARSQAKIPQGPGPGTIPSLDVNRAGNHLGTLDVGVVLRFARGRAVLYRQHIIEDGSLFYLENIADGLNGLRWFRTDQPTGPFSLNRLTLEYLNTDNQGGEEFDAFDPQRRGRDNYYNHGQYRDGWSYFGRTIGTPLIPPYTDLTAKQRLNKPFTTNNRVQAFHVGAAGAAFGRLGWETKFTYSLNRGTYDDPLRPSPQPQASGLVRARAAINALGGFEANLAVAWDRGGLYDDATGVYAGLRKTWHSGRGPVVSASPRSKPRSRTVSPQRF